MEDVLFGIAVAMFVISAVSAIASVVVFKKLEVADAIRFLRHRTTASGVGLVGVLAHKPKQRKAKGEDLERDTAPSIARKKGKHEREELNDGQGTSSELAASASLSKKGSDKLQGDSSSERPTEMLACGDSENPTEILSFAGSGDGGLAEQAGADVGPEEALDSERPTEMLESIDAVERKTTCLEPPPGSASAAAPAEEESVFWFRIKQSQIVVNTDETIE